MLTWTILLIFYVSFLRKEKYFAYNRVFLLSSIAIGLLMPVVPQFSFLSKSPLSNFAVNMPAITITNQDFNAVSSTGFDYSSILIFIYISGLLYFVFNLVKSLYHIKRIYDNGEIIQSDTFKIVKVRGSIVAFSFFNYIFINEDLYDSKQKNEILLHESIHVNQGHSYDIIFLEILKSIFWFNPVIHIFKPMLIETHEFLADNYVIQKISKKSYSELLINQLQSGVQYNIANYFINSLIKNRIKMMYKTKANNKWRYLIALPILVFVMLFVNACQNRNDEEAKSVKAQETETIYKVVEEMPRFPGCENESTKENIEKCATSKLYNYLYEHLVYPTKAQEKGVQGKVVVRFVVDSNGNVKNAKILKGIGGGCGDEVLKVLESMNHLPEKWIPGRQGGKAVSVYYTLPVIFKMTD